MLNIKNTLPSYCNALLLELSPDGLIQNVLEVPFINDNSIYVDKKYLTDKETYINPIYVLGFDDCEIISDGGIIQIEWEGYIFAVMTEKTYSMYYRRV